MDLMELQTLISEHSSYKIPIIAKIEKPEAVENIDKTLVDHYIEQVEKISEILRSLPAVHDVTQSLEASRDTWQELIFAENASRGVVTIVDHTPYSKLLSGECSGAGGTHPPEMLCGRNM